MSTILDDAPVLDETDSDDPSKHSHIVHDKAKVTAAYINGTPVTALCGYTWVPSKDPKSLPLCSKCKEIRKNAGGDLNNLS